MHRSLRAMRMIFCTMYTVTTPIKILLQLVYLQTNPYQIFVNDIIPFDLVVCFPMLLYQSRPYSDRLNDSRRCFWWQVARPHCDINNDIGDVIGRADTFRGMYKANRVRMLSITQKLEMQWNANAQRWKLLRCDGNWYDFAKLTHIYTLHNIRSWHELTWIYHLK